MTAVPDAGESAKKSNVTNKGNNVFGKTSKNKLLQCKCKYINIFICKNGKKKKKKKQE